MGDCACGGGTGFCVATAGGAGADDAAVAGGVLALAGGDAVGASATTSRVSDELRARHTNHARGTTTTAAIAIAGRIRSGTCCRVTGDADAIGCCTIGRGGSVCVVVGSARTADAATGASFDPMSGVSAIRCISLDR